jgi:hypothetical protein
MGATMIKQRFAKAAGVGAMALALGLGSAGDALAWQTSFTSNGKASQSSPVRSVKKGKHFLNVCIKGNGKTKFTAELYKQVKGKDPLIQKLSGKDSNVCWMAPFKQMSAGKYYFTVHYPKKGKKVSGGVQ